MHTLYTCVYIYIYIQYDTAVAAGGALRRAVGGVAHIAFALLSKLIIIIIITIIIVIIISMIIIIAISYHHYW